jgi:hypothetical protein
LLLALSLIGCIKPGDRFDQFEQRVVDASQVVNSCSEASARRTGPLGAIADVTGDALLAAEVTLAPGSILQFRCTLDLTDGDPGVLDMSCQPLDVDVGVGGGGPRTDVGAPLGQENVGVGVDGTYCATFFGDIPGQANPISGSPITIDPEVGFKLAGTIRTPDLSCGTLEGAIVEPFVSPVSGTFAMVRAPTGAMGDDLPEPVVACPDTGGEPDAGLPDAGLPDAML